MSIEKASSEYVRARTLATRLDCGESTIWRLVKEKLLPPPTVKIGKRCTLWKWSDIEVFLSAQAEGDHA